MNRPKPVRVTCCELPEYGPAFAAAWTSLAAHVRAHRSEIVVLPEMPFSPWFATEKRPDAAVWERTVESHEQWTRRCGELGAAVVVGSRPVQRGADRFNEGFVWTATEGARAVHTKSFLPDEEGYWEASWYRGADGTCTVFQAGPARAGMRICTDLWSMGHAQQLGHDGAQVIFIPRVTQQQSIPKWIAGGQVAGVVAGAFTISSNRGDSGDGLFGGTGWITDPDGRTLGQTSQREPFVTRELDLALADAAKSSYPRDALYRSA